MDEGDGNDGGASGHAHLLEEARGGGGSGGGHDGGSALLPLAEDGVGKAHGLAMGGGYIVEWKVRLKRK